MKTSSLFLVPALTLAVTTSGCMTTYQNNKVDALPPDVYEKGGTLYLKNADDYAQKQPTILLLQGSSKSTQSQPAQVQYSN